MELSEGQFEQLVGMLADNRVQLVNAKHEILNELEKTKRDLREEIRAVAGAAATGHHLLASQLTAIEEDLGKIQATQRSQEAGVLALSQDVAKINQSMEGITQLTRSTWDLTESLQKYIHGEARSDHGAGLGSHRSQ